MNRIGYLFYWRLGKHWYHGCCKVLAFLAVSDRSAKDLHVHQHFSLQLTSFYPFTMFRKVYADLLYLVLIHFLKGDGKR